MLIRMKSSSHPRISFFAPVYTLALISVASANPASASSVELISGPDEDLSGFVDRSLNSQDVFIRPISDPRPSGLQAGFEAIALASLPFVRSELTQNSSVITGSESFVIDYDAVFFGVEQTGGGRFGEAETLDLLREQLESGGDTLGVGVTELEARIDAEGFSFSRLIAGDVNTSLNATYRLQVNESIDFDLDFVAGGEDRFSSVFSLSEIDPVGTDSRVVFEIDQRGGNDTPFVTFRLAGGEVGFLNQNFRRGSNEEDIQSLVDQAEELLVVESSSNGGSFVGQLQPGLYEIDLRGGSGSDTGQLAVNHRFTFTATSSAVAIPTPTAAFAGLTLLGGLAIRRRR